MNEFVLRVHTTTGRYRNGKRVLLFRKRGVDHSRYQRRRNWYHLELGKLSFHINGAWLPDFNNTRPR